MTIQLVQTNEESHVDKLIALSRVLEIVTDPGRVLPPNHQEIARITSEKLLNLINGVSTTTSQAGNH